MTVITANEAKHRLDALITEVVSNAEPTIIITETGEQIVLLPLAEFNAWQETAYLLSKPANAAHQTITPTRYKADAPTRQPPSLVSLR